MPTDLIEAFMNEEVRVSWHTQDEIEQLADAVDSIIGRTLGRQYMRGYSPSQYAYWGIGSVDESEYVLWSSSSDYNYTFDEFMSLIGADNSSDDTVIDIAGLL